MLITSRVEAGQVPESSLVELNCDSLELCDVVIKIEDYFGVTIKENEINDDMTITEITNVIERKMN